MNDQIATMRDTARQMQAEAIRLLIDALTLERQASERERAEQAALDRRQRERDLRLARRLSGPGVRLADDGRM